MRRRLLPRERKNSCRSTALSSAENAAEALEKLLSALAPDEALVVAGSLYLASELRPRLMRFKGKTEPQS